jgi:hypothetical protein
MKAVIIQASLVGVPGPSRVEIAYTAVRTPGFYALLKFAGYSFDRPSASVYAEVKVAIDGVHVVTAYFVPKETKEAEQVKNLRIKIQALVQFAQAQEKSVVA